MGSQLSARIRREADEAHSRRREIDGSINSAKKLLGKATSSSDECPFRIISWRVSRLAPLSCSFRRRKSSIDQVIGAAHLDEEKMKTAFLRDEMTIESSQEYLLRPSTSRRAGHRESFVFPGKTLGGRRSTPFGSLVAIAIERGESR